MREGGPISYEPRLFDVPARARCGLFSWEMTALFYMSTRWSTTLSLKVNLPHAIDFRAKCGVNFVT